MRLGRVLVLCLLLSAVFAPVSVYAQDSEHAPVEVQGHPEQAATDHIPGEVHEEGGGSMPQLDPTYFASQLFWLVISAGLMYVLMAKIALPRVAKILAVRDDQVRHDLEKAARLKQEAEDIKVSYTRALRDADERGRSLNERTLKEMRDQQTKNIEAGAARINQQISDTEKTLATQTANLLKEVDAISKNLSETVIRELTSKAA